MKWVRDKLIPVGSPSSAEKSFFPAGFPLFNQSSICFCRLRTTAWVCFWAEAWSMYREAASSSGSPRRRPGGPGW